MAYATDAQLLERYPVAAEASLAQRSAALDDAEERIDDELFGGSAVRAHCLLALHYLQLDGAIAGGEGGAVTSRRMGEIAASYATPAGTDGPHGSTAYGRQFDQIVASILHTPIAG